MNYKQVVEIYVPHSGFGGTGYLIQNDLILTAYHVVACCEGTHILQSSEILCDIRFIGEFEAGETAWRDEGAKLHWYDSKYDLALLKLRGARPSFLNSSNEMSIQFGRLGGETFSATGVGFPKVQKIGNRQNPEPLEGKLSRIAGLKEKQLRLQVTSLLPAKPEDWSGISGTALFVGNYFVGVITETNKSFGEKALWATPISLLAENQEFCKLILNNSNSSHIDLYDLISPVDADLTGSLPAGSPMIEITPKYAEKLKIHDRYDLERLSAFFVNTIKVMRSTEMASIGILDIIHEIPIDDSLDFFILSGGQGTGKTAFLSVLYTALKSEAISQRRQRYPLFLSVENYSNPINEEDDIRRIIDRDIETLQQIIRQNKSQRFVLMVDGLTSRENELSEIICEQILWNFDFKKFDAVLWSMADGFEESLKKLVDRSRETQRKNPPDFNVKRIKICSIKADLLTQEIMKNFIFLQMRINGSNTEDADLDQEVIKLEERLSELGVEDELDHHTLSLIYEKINFDHYFDNANIATFFQRYCSEQLTDGVETKDKTPSNIQMKLREAAWLAYRTVIATFYANKEHCPEELKIEKKDKNTRYWNLVFQHGNIRDFLVAWYIIDIIRYENSNKKSNAGFSANPLNTEIIKKGRLDYDFPQVINAFIRSILESNSTTRSNTVRNITRLLRQIDTSNLKQRWQTSNFLCYLLGRGGVTGEEQVRLLENAASEVEKKLENETGESRIQLLTQYRTISISLIRFGSNNNSKFLLRLISDKQFASVDRGYHRLYYGDTPYFKDKVPNCYLDDTDEGWSKSFEVLKSRIDKEILSSDNGNTDLDRKELDVQKQHYVFTLVSFIQSRIRKESSICTEAQKAYALHVMDILLVYPRALHPDVQHYLSMIRIDLKQGNLFSSRWRFILDLYRLKWEPRRGWLLRELQKEFWEGRIESVADHSYMTLLLATFLLPEKLEEEEYRNYPEYQREAVIQKLIFHDVAEAYTGDFVHHLLGENAKLAMSKEWDALAYLHYKDTYSGLNNTQAVFRASLDFAAAEGTKFAEVGYPSLPPKASDNAKFARDIDKLENLIQLFIYKEMYPKFISDESFKSYVDNLLDMNTNYVRNLANGFIRWARSQQGNMLYWSDKFFEASLLQKQDCIRKLGDSS